MTPTYQVIVVGAGINGLATAKALLELGVSSLAVLEQLPLGHGQGSSHGRSRITRSSYNSPKYIELMQLVHAQFWPEWERQAGQKFLHPTPGLFFGPCIQAYRQSLEQVPQVWSQIETLSPAQARDRFAPFLFPDTQEILVDHTCAVIAAHRSMDFLRHALRDHIQEQVQLQHFDCGSQLQLTTSRGPMQCERLILTAGPWTSRLLGRLAPQLRPAHQDVGYFTVEASQKVGEFPVWVYTGETDHSFYGLPEFERPGVKLARHRTGPHGDDPDRPIAENLPEIAYQDLLAFAQKQWRGKAQLVGYDACIYTNTVSEDFILDPWPEDPRVVVGAGFSGHGFKFAPLTGQVLAQLALHGHTNLPEFERHRPAFGFQAAQSW